MINSMKRNVIEKKILDILIDGTSSRSKIIEACSHLGSEPTIQSVLKEMVSRASIKELTQKIGFGEGRPPKYYQILQDTEKRNYGSCYEGCIILKETLSCLYSVFSSVNFV